MADIDFGVYPVFQEALVRGEGTIWPISGWIGGDIDQIKKIYVEVNHRKTNPTEIFKVPHKIVNIDFFGTPLLTNRIHFCHFIQSSEVPEDHLQVAIVAETSDGEQRKTVLDRQLFDQMLHPPDQLPSAKIAICMTTFNPKINLFEKQVNSIIRQTETSWQLIINDDGSDLEIFNRIKSIAKKDKRIVVFRNEKNLGFYYNFERTLSRVHSQFKFIALADQDDYWFEQKLSTLLNHIGTNKLVYNDMLIEDANGNIISNTFWNHRSNHYKSHTALMLANTVTGSASLFCTSLLKKILPFPPRLGNAFHDHWLAMTAAVDSNLTYHDEVLQAYVQHDSNVTGYGQFKQINMGQSTMSFLSLQRMKTVLYLDQKNEKYIRFVNNNLKVYFDAYMRRKLQYKIIVTRHPHWQRRSLDKIFNSDSARIQRLLTMHWQIYKKNWMTNNAELSYINAIEVMNQLSIKKRMTLES